MRVEREMSNHFLVGKLVAFCGLNDTVKHKHVSVVGRLEDKNVLEERPLMMQHFNHLECHG